MGRTVEELLASMTSAELSRWLAYSRIEPWGDQRSDYHAAMIALLIYTVNAGKNSPRLGLEDFLLDFTSEKEPQTGEGMKAMIQTYTQHLGGKINGEILPARLELKPEV